jgi:hypothetical protein
MHPYDIIIDAYPWGNGDNILQMSELDAFYNDKGFLPNGTSEEDADVMYYSGYHAAKKKNCTCGAGKWIMFESKLGEWFAVEHVWNHLNGTFYGIPSRFYKQQ